MKAISQISIKPGLMPRLSSTLITSSSTVSSSVLTEYEEDNQRDNQGVNSDRFRKGYAQDHVGLNGRRMIRIAPHGMHRAAYREADADAAAGSADHGQACAYRFTQDNR